MMKSTEKGEVMGNITVLRVVSKELKDIIRDKRSLFISLVFPMLLFPLIFGAFESSLLSPDTGRDEKIKIGITITGDNRAEKIISLHENITLLKSDDPVEMLKQREVSAAVTVNGDSEEEIIITADNSRRESVSAATAVAALFSAQPGAEETVNESIIKNRVNAGNGGHQFSVSSRTLYPPEIGSSMLTLSIILPLLLMTFTSVSTTAVAADLGAGEKERQTLEPLLANPASRIQILAGKFLAVTIMGIAGVLSFTAGIVISYFINPDFLGTGPLVFTVKGAPLAVLCIQTILLSMIFGSAELALSISARSVKEAQLMFIPLLMVSMACGYSVTMITPESGAAEVVRHIPLVNIGLLIKEISLGSASGADIIATLAWSVVYTALFLAAALAFFSSEKVILRS